MQWKFDHRPHLIFNFQLGCRLGFCKLAQLIPALDIDKHIGSTMQSDYTPSLPPEQLEGNLNLLVGPDSALGRPIVVENSQYCRMMTMTT